MTGKIFENYGAFYNMVLSTTIMSNSPTKEYEKDAKKIIDFIGKAYKLNGEFIEYCTSLILNELSSLALTTDQEAVYSSRKYGDVYGEKDVLFDIKGDVLSKLQNIGEQKNPEINASWFDYSHYKTYQANVRFSKIKSASASGNIIATRQVGILKILGIGCKKDSVEAIRSFKNCAFWGNIPAMFYLAYTYDKIGDKKQSKIFYELADLCRKYLKAGYTVLPSDAKQKYSEEARTYYVYISTIKQDVVYAYNKPNIDLSFIEAITSSSLDYFARMNYINNYDRKEWKNVTNSSEKPSRELGFK